MTTGEVYLDRYKVMQVLKDTGDVCVLLAEHVQLHSYWIIKKLNKTNALYRRELEILKSIHHKGIPLIVDVFEEEESLIIIKEYIEGVTLDRFMEDEIKETGSIGLTEAKVIDIGLGLCDVLIFLHERLERPLIYRDVKPANIILTGDNEIYLIDFGIARYHDFSKNRDTEYLGTIGFAGPEAFGIAQSDQRSDVFGLGATLYFLLTGKDLGKPPYTHEAIHGLRSDISRDLEKVLVKACTINMNERFQSIRDMKKELQGLIVVKEENVIEKLLTGFKEECFIVKGITRGVGVTYLTMRLAKRYTQEALKPLIIDMSESEDLLSLEFQDDSVYNNHILIYKGIHIISYKQLNNIYKDYSEVDISNYDLVIFDGDPIKKEKGLQEFLQGCQAYKLRVATIAPWNMDEFEEFVLTPGHEDEHIILNKSSIKDYKEIKKSIEHINISYLHHKNYDDLDKDIEMDKLLNELGVKRIWKRGKGFLGQIMPKVRLVERIKP